MRKSAFLSSLLLAACAGFEAQSTALAECNGLKVATGQPSKGFSKLFADIAKICGSEVSLCEVTTNGGVDNLESLSLKEADVGFAQIDAANAMKNGNENIAALQAVAGLNFSYLHVIVAAQGFTAAADQKKGWLTRGDPKIVTIQHFTDLKGQKVALVGTAQLLGRQLEKLLSYGLNFIDVEKDGQAFDMVRTGEVAAAFSVAGWPNGAIAPLKQESGLSLVPFDAPVTLPYLVRPLNYRGLGVYNNNALAIPNLLLTRPFKGERAQEVAKLQHCIASKLPELQEGSYQPGWNEIKDPGNTYDWPKFHGHPPEQDAKPRR